MSRGNSELLGILQVAFLTLAVVGCSEESRDRDASAPRGDGGGIADVGAGGDDAGGTTNNDAGGTTGNDAGGTMGNDAGSSGGAICRFSCTQKEDCGNNGQGYLSCDNGKCIQCMSNSDCDSNTYKGGCNTTYNTCMLCDENSDCTYGPLQCETTLGYCKFCASDADCVVAGTTLLSGKCNVTQGLCARCDSNADCGYVGSPGPYCVNDTCVACMSDNDCTKGVYNTGKCDTSNNSCIKCENNMDCTDAYAMRPGTWECR